MVMCRKQKTELPDQSRQRQLTLFIDERLYKGLHAAAVKLDVSRTVYVQMLLEAAHAARHGGTGDTQLEDVVGAVLLLYGSAYDTATIARVLKITEPQVVTIVQQWKSRDRRAAKAA